MKIKAMRIPVIISIALVTIFACAGSRHAAIKQAIPVGAAGEYPDSVINTLQKNNELVLGYALENNAWAKTTFYRLLVLNKGNWQAYKYTVQNRKRPAKNAVVSEESAAVKVSVNNAACDSVLQFFIKQQVWKINDHKGRFLCDSTNTSCNISDAGTEVLLMLTPGHITRLSFYAPAFFEQCCPGNKDRKLFIEACDKIKKAGRTD